MSNIYRKAPFARGEKVGPFTVYLENPSTFNGCVFYKRIYSQASATVSTTTIKTVTAANYSTAKISGTQTALPTSGNGIVEFWAMVSLLENGNGMTFRKEFGAYLYSGEYDYEEEALMGSFIAEGSYENHRSLFALYNIDNLSNIFSTIYLRMGRAYRLYDNLNPSGNMTIRACGTETGAREDYSHRESSLLSSSLFYKPVALYPSGTGDYDLWGVTGDSDRFYLYFIKRNIDSAFFPVIIPYREAPIIQGKDEYYFMQEATIYEGKNSLRDGHADNLIPICKEGTLSFLNNLLCPFPYQYLELKLYITPQEGNQIVVDLTDFLSRYNLSYIDGVGNYYSIPAQADHYQIIINELIENYEGVFWTLSLRVTDGFLSSDERFIYLDGTKSDRDIFAAQYPVSFFDKLTSLLVASNNGYGATSLTGVKSNYYADDIFYYGDIVDNELNVVASSNGILEIPYGAVNLSSYDCYILDSTTQSIVRSYSFPSADYLTNSTMFIPSWFGLKTSLGVKAGDSFDIKFEVSDILGNKFILVNFSSEKKCAPLPYFITPNCSQNLAVVRPISPIVQDLSIVFPYIVDESLIDSSLVDNPYFSPYNESYFSYSITLKGDNFQGDARFGLSPELTTISDNGNGTYTVSMSSINLKNTLKQFYFFDMNKNYQNCYYEIEYFGFANSITLKSQFFVLQYEEDPSFSSPYYSIYHNPIMNDAAIFIESIINPYYEEVGTIITDTKRKYPLCNSNEQILFKFLKPQDLNEDFDPKPSTGEAKGKYRIERKYGSITNYDINNYPIINWPAQWELEKEIANTDEIYEEVIADPAAIYHYIRLTTPIVENNKCAIYRIIAVDSKGNESQPLLANTDSALNGVNYFVQLCRVKSTRFEKGNFSISIIGNGETFPANTSGIGDTTGITHYKAGTQLKIRDLGGSSLNSLQFSYSDYIKAKNLERIYYNNNGSIYIPYITLEMGNTLTPVEQEDGTVINVLDSNSLNYTIQTMYFDSLINGYQDLATQNLDFNFDITNTPLAPHALLTEERVFCRLSFGLPIGHQKISGEIQTRELTFISEFTFSSQYPLISHRVNSIGINQKNVNADEVISIRGMETHCKIKMEGEDEQHNALFYIINLNTGEFSGTIDLGQWS